MRYFIYCRKSTEAEDRQVASIESQLTALNRTFAGRPDVEIIRVYEEAFSAKAPGRSIFGEMMTQIEKGAAEGIVAWAPDRLARNSIDGGRIVYLLDCGTIKDLKFATYTFENNPQGKFMLQIMFGQSKYYSDALSENVRRGIRTKVEKGWRCGKAPQGYRNDPVTRTIQPDPERFPLIREMFDLILGGTHSPKRVWEVARNEWGYRTPKCKRMGGMPIAVSMVYRILTSPFYAGLIIWEGRTYKGAHTPVVTVEEFERVQALLGQKEKPRPHHRRFAFTGMIRCGNCGLLVTAEEKTNRFGSRYTYYHCTRRRQDLMCRQPSITVQEMERQIERFLGTVRLPQRIADWAQRQLSAEQADVERMAESQKQSARNTLVQIERELANVVSLRVRDLISDAEFISERNRLEQTRIGLQQQFENEGKSDATFEPDRVLISFSNRALDWFRVGDMETKRLILNSVGSNPTLKDKILCVQAKKPFHSISECGTFPGLCGFRDEIRTLMKAQDPGFLKVLDNIRKLEIKFGVRSEDGTLRQAA